MGAITVNVNPKTLIWAREELGFHLDDVASKIKKDIDTIQDWEAHGKNLRYTDLVKLSKLYKRQVPVFFLNNTPAKTAKPKDFRNLSVKSRGLSPDAMLAIRRTKRYLDLYREHTPANQLTEQYKWVQTIKEYRHNGLEQALRDLLDVPISEQKKAKNKTLKFWRNRIEERLGVFVFQFPVDSHEFDGFSYIADGVPFGITLNSRVAEKRKIFTIFHEIGHIIEGTAGICITSTSQQTRQIEARCNKFAATFLMPREEVATPSSFEELQQYADELGVSKEAYLIRAYDLKLVKDGDFNKYMTTIQQMNKKIAEEQRRKNKDKDGFVPRDVVSKSYRGDKFFDFVLEAYDTNRISPAVVRDVLDLKLVGLGRFDR